MFWGLWGGPPPLHAPPISSRERLERFVLFNEENKMNFHMFLLPGSRIIDHSFRIEYRYTLGCSISKEMVILRSIFNLLSHFRGVSQWSLDCCLKGRGSGILVPGKLNVRLNFGEPQPPNFSTVVDPPKYNADMNTLVQCLGEDVYPR